MIVLMNFMSSSFVEFRINDTLCLAIHGSLDDIYWKSLGFDTADEKYMKYALEEAKKAYLKNEVPVGAIIVKDGKIIAKAHNKKVSTKNIFGHAEILVIKKTAEKIGDWRLNDCDMYVTLEPCTMCAGAIINSRIKKVYVGTMDEKTGAVGSVLNLFEDYTFNYKVESETGILKQECENILKKFFKELRSLKNGG